MDTTKTCANCSHCTSIPVGENGFECCKLICDKNRPEFPKTGRADGTCEIWNAKGVPFYLQKTNEK